MSPASCVAQQEGSVAWLLGASTAWLVGASIRLVCCAAGSKRCLVASLPALPLSGAARPWSAGQGCGQLRPLTVAFAQQRMWAGAEVDGRLSGTSVKLPHPVGGCNAPRGQSCSAAQASKPRSRTVTGAGDGEGGSAGSSSRPSQRQSRPSPFLLAVCNPTCSFDLRCSRSWKWEAAPVASACMPCSACSCLSACW